MTEGGFGGTGIVAPQAEEDLSGAGWKTPRGVWTVTGYSEESASDKDGSGIRATLTYSTQVNGKTVEVKDRVWKSHTAEGAGSPGWRAGQRKRLYIALFGGAKGMLSAGTVLGKSFSAEGSEDDAGFRRVRNMRATSNASVAAPLISAAGL